MLANKQYDPPILCVLSYLLLDDDHYSLTIPYFLIMLCLQLYMDTHHIYSTLYFERNLEQLLILE